jgi:osmotically-inducible protein OsmY
MIVNTSRAPFAGIFPGTILTALACWAALAGADEATTPGAGGLKQIVVTGRKQQDPVADEKMRKQVEAALRADPHFYAEHVTVTIVNGVAMLQGIVFDDWDMRAAMRISKRVAGVKRVVNEIEIEEGGD